jgi:hypothetical protein
MNGLKKILLQLAQITSFIFGHFYSLLWIVNTNLTHDRLIISVRITEYTSYQVKFS